MIKNKEKKSIFILSFILLLVLSISLNIDMVHAKTKLPEQSREFYVYDESGIIDGNLESYIIGVNRELNDKIGAQVVVAEVDN